ncbi:MAG: hypothetical protein JO025_22030 [Verrucomicrobia bacterium]|nr:hypothetical protein [Verrucomicrobiota bacterium]
MKLLLPYTSERRFFIIQYLIGHGLLLLRSNKPDKQSKRIDILFNDVRAMEIRCWFDGITIEETDKSFLASHASRPLDLMEHGNRAYSLKGRGWTGFILGGIVSYNQDDEVATAPSALLKNAFGYEPTPYGGIKRDP